MRRREPIATALFAAALAVGRVAHASPEDLFGFGARPAAMGGLGATFADDFAAVWANPAGLSRAHAGAFTLGFVGGSYALSAGVGAVPPSHIPVQTARATTIGA